MKKLIVILTLFVSAFLLTNNIYADDNTSTVTDRAKLFSNNQIQELLDDANEFENEFDISLHYLIVPHLNGNASLEYMAIQEIANYYESIYGPIDYDKKKNNEDTIIVLLSVNSNSVNSKRHIEISCYGTVDKYISNSDVQDLIDEIINDLSSGQYYRALYNFTGVLTDHVSFTKLVQNILPHGVILLVSLVIAGSVGFSLVRTASASVTVGNRTYMKEGSAKLLGRYDRFVGRTVTRTPIPTSSSGGSSGGGGGGRSSGGGRSF